MDDSDDSAQGSPLSNILFSTSFWPVNQHKKCLRLTEVMMLATIDIRRKKDGNRDM